MVKSLLTEARMDPAVEVTGTAVVMYVYLAHHTLSVQQVKSPKENSHKRGRKSSSPGG